MAYKSPLNEVLDAHCRALSSCLSHNDSTSRYQNSVLSRNVSFLSKTNESSNIILTSKTKKSQISMNEYKNTNFSSLLLDKMKHSLLIQKDYKSDMSSSDKNRMMNNPFISDGIKNLFSSTIQALSSRNSYEDNKSSVYLDEHYQSNSISRKKNEIKNLLSKHSNDTFSFRRQKSPKILNELNARYNIKRINSKEFFYINKKKKNDSTYQIKSSAPYEQKLNDLLSKTKGRNILSPYQKINTVKSSLEKIINRPKQHLISSESQKYIIKKKLDDYVNEYENFARELNCN